MPDVDEPAERPFSRSGHDATGRAEWEIRGNRSAFAASWPAYAIAVFVGLFCAVVTGAWIVGHVIRGEPVDDTALIIAAATVLRVVTVVIALASVRQWGSRIPAPLLVAALWGCAAAQLVYPLAELVVKLLILADVVEPPARGIGAMTVTGWLNLGAAWLIFGVPGALFLVAAASYRNRRGYHGVLWPVLGLVGGVASIGVLGLAIG